MRKLFSFVAVVLSVILVVTGCSSKSSKDNSTNKSNLKVVVVTDEGGAKDKSFNQSNAEALTSWVEKNGGKALTPVETKNHSDLAANMQSASKAADVISLAGFYFEKELPKMADAFPDKKYIFIDGVVEKANVASVTFAEQEAGYLAGYAAALQSKTGKVGFIGGAKIPTVARFGIGFVQGAKAANKDIKVVYNYSGSFSDTNKGKTIAATMYDTGADVIFVAAGGTGNGAIKEAQERATQDQYTDGIFKAKDKDGKDVEKSVVVASGIKRVDVAVKNVLDSIKEGKFEGGKEHIFTIKEDGIELTLENPNLNEETKSKIKNKIAELKTGKESVVAEADKLTDKNNIDGEL